MTQRGRLAPGLRFGTGSRSGTSRFCTRCLHASRRRVEKPRFASRGVSRSREVGQKAERRVERPRGASRGAEGGRLEVRELSQERPRGTPRRAKRRVRRGREARREPGAASRSRALRPAWPRRGIHTTGYRAERGQGLTHKERASRARIVPLQGSRANATERLPRDFPGDAAATPRRLSFHAIRSEGTAACCRARSHAGRGRRRNSATQKRKIADARPTRRHTLRHLRLCLRCKRLVGRVSGDGTAATNSGRAPWTIEIGHAAPPQGTRRSPVVRRHADGTLQLQ